MKNYLSEEFFDSAKRLLRKMRTTCILLFVFASSLYATNVNSQVAKVNIQLKNAPLIQVIRTIENQTDYLFVYDKNEIDLTQQVNINAEDQSVTEVLTQIFSDAKVEYGMVGSNIVLMPAESFSQQAQSVSGRVTDSSGEPLPGVTIIVQETTKGTVTDFDGNYTISGVQANETLVFSFVGMKSLEVIVGNQSTINVVMEEDAIGIEEVVAIGYGVAKKADLTGAIGTVQGEMITERKSTQLSQALQGAMSGVMVTRNNNAPGSGASIRIRGVTTIGDSEPLVIVDGIPVDNINDINPNDVESISVLKDAASASIYGARAAAGVILVTTKRAKTGDLSLEYSLEYGIEKPTVSPDYVGPARYMEIANEYTWNDIGNPGDNEYPTYSKDLVDNYIELNRENPDLYPITDWRKIILKSSAPRQSHVINISAGTKSIRSKVSLGYDKADGLYDGLSYERYSARFSNDATINSFIETSLDLYFVHRINNTPQVSERDVMYFTRISAPIYAAQWSDGRVASGKNGDNIFGALKYGGFDDSKSNLLTGKASIDIKPLDGMKISAVFSPQVYSLKGKSFNTAVPYYSWDDPTAFEGYVTRISSTTKLAETRNDNYRLTTQFLASYIKTFGEHNINALAGYESFYAFNEDLGASRDQYILNSFPYLNLGPLEFRDNSGKAWENAYQSAIGRLMYNYNNKYFIQGNFRYDGSSRFHSDYRWGFFPSFSAGWAITEEKFLDALKEDTYIKLRASYGTLGNERIGNYPYQASIAFDNALFAHGADVLSAQAAAQRQYVIQSISWETTESLNVGFDSYWFENKFRVSADYFKKTTSDMLLALEIPDYIGFDNPDQNTGKMFTKGWELEAGYGNRVGDLNYSFSFNLSDFKSMMGDLGGTEFLGSQIKIEGSEFNEWYGYKSDGLFQTEEEIDNSALLRANTNPGDIKYVDISGPDGEPDGIISPEYDRVLLGGSLPRYMYGANLRADYKNFDFSVVIQGVGKQNSRMSNVMVQPLVETWGNVPSIIDGKYWSIYNTDAENINAKYPRVSNSSNTINYAMSDYWLFNGGYFRLKNITLGYTLPSSFLQKLDVEQLRVYASFSDVFTLSNYPKGWDPEVSATGYPITTSALFGLSIKF